MKKLTLIGLIYLICSAAALCQIVCPAGSQPVTFGATRNTVTDQIQPNYCVSPSGTLISKVADGGQAVYDVTGFGVVGNGVHDDTEAFKSAISNACPGSTTGSVLIPKSIITFISTISSYTFPSNCTLIIDGELKFNTAACPASSCTLVFAGQNQTVKGTGTIDNTGGTNTPILIGKGASNFTLSGSLTIQNARDGAIGTTVLAGSGSSIGPLLISGLTMQGDNCDLSTPVFALQLGTEVSDAIISNVVSISGCDYQFGVDGSSNVIFQNIFSDQTNSSLVNYGGIQIEATSGPVTNINVNGATFIAPATSGNSLMGVSVASPNYNLSGVHVRNVTVIGFGYGIKFQQIGTGELDAVSLDTSDVSGSGLSCIIMLPTGNAKMSGNEAYNCNQKRSAASAFEINGTDVLAIGNYAFDNQATHTTGAGFAYGGTVYCANADGPGVTVDTGSCTSK